MKAMVCCIVGGGGKGRQWSGVDSGKRKAMMECGW